MKAALRQAVLAADPGGRSAGEIARYASDRYLDDLVRWTRKRERARPRPEPQQPEVGTTPVTLLPPYYGAEAPDREAALAEQGGFIRGWIGDQRRFALARREVKRRAQAAHAEAGLDDTTTSPEERGRKAAITRRVKREVLAE